MARPLIALLPVWMAMALTLPIAANFGGQACAAGLQNDRRVSLSEADAKAISALHLRSAVLANQELSNVHGGFDPAPNITLNFAFIQTTYANHQLIQSILVPNTTITLSSGTGPVVAQQTASAAMQLPAQGLPSGLPVTAPALRLGQPNAIGAPAILATQSPVTVMSEVQPTGITSVIRNTANGQLVQQITSINIGITGLNQLLSRQTQALSLMTTLAQDHVPAHN